MWVPSAASLLGAAALSAGVAAVMLGPRSDVSADDRPPAYRTHNDRLTPREYTSPSEWARRASYLREHVLVSHGLMPLPEKTPLHPVVFDERAHEDYSVAKVYFESLPGFYVTGNLYRPIGPGPFPAVLLPHGHWTYGRLENTEVASIPGAAISLARQGFVAFTYDMVGYDDSRQVPHTFGGRREALWGLSLAGLQLWNGIRSLDFLESLAEVDKARLASGGASGGGTQTFLLAAVDDRVKVAVPVNMISLHMQGGCLCENPPLLRLDTNNVELGALTAPRPMLMVSASGDWTAETPRVEFPAMRRLFTLAGAPEDHLASIQVQAEHNFNKQSREALYTWLARWLQGAPADARVAEKPFRPDPLGDLLVFHERPLPEGAVTPEQLTAKWIAAAREQWARSDPRAWPTALVHSLGMELPEAASPSSPSAAPAPARSRTVVLATSDATLRPALVAAGFTVHPVDFSPFDAEAAAKIEHFATYNRTAASQRVADIVRALRQNPGAALVADGDAGPAGLLALAVAPASRAVIGVAGFDTSSDDAYLERLDIPGLRRAGGLQTAASMAALPIVVHDAGPRFDIRAAGMKVLAGRLASADVARALDER